LLGSKGEDRHNRPQRLFGLPSSRDFDRCIEQRLVEVADEDVDLDLPVAGDRYGQAVDLPNAVFGPDGAPLDRLDARHRVGEDEGYLLRGEKLGVLGIL